MICSSLFLKEFVFLMRGGTMILAIFGYYSRQTRHFAGVHTVDKLKIEKKARVLSPFFFREFSGQLLTVTRNGTFVP